MSRQHPRINSHLCSRFRVQGLGFFWAPHLEPAESSSKALLCRNHITLHSPPKLETPNPEPFPGAWHGALRFRGYRGYIGLYRDNGKENGNYYNGLYKV